MTGLPRLNLTFLAAIPLGFALGTLLEFLARLNILAAFGAKTLFGTFKPLEHLPRVAVSLVARFLNQTSTVGLMLK